MVSKRPIALVLAAVMLSGGAWLGSGAAQAASPCRNHDCRPRSGAQHWHSSTGLVDYQTGKILKGGLVGAGIGAGSALLLDRNVGKTTLAGAGIGAGVQAVRYSRTMQRHPIVKTAAYGALTGTGVAALSRRGSLGKGALWGGAIGTGLGALQHL